ncbi:MAG: N-6 DNA methylase [Melioribacteraceae bacterium]|nr:N-6 DNA methylase [Melioribacteraceae bacterium]
MTKNYLSNLFKTYQKGDAREESYYKHLADFITQFSEAVRRKKIDVTILPKKTEAGNPDFRIWDGKQKIIGYIEAKDLGTDLDRIEETPQLERYLSTFPNVILTNFTEFRLYRNGEMIDQISIARPFIIKKLSTSPPIENEVNLFELLERFLDFSLPRTYTAKTLAVELAKRTRFLKDEIVSEELKQGTKSIHGFYDAFKEFLIAGINEDEFADIYSQTITYGLFAARLRAEKDFNRKLAFSYIPKSIGILRDVFKFISLEDLPQQMEVIIDDIAEVLSAADAKKILDQYYHEGKGSDPVLHFYETFLSIYDPKTREKRGVYYTPEPVVSFIVRSLHQILKEKFDIGDGLASKDVTLLDPAGGTLSFLAKAIETAVEEFEGKYGRGAVKTFLKEQILQNYYSFELMMAPYAIGHMKMSFLLEELGYRMEDDERVKYYLTNTLEMKELDESRFPGMSSLSQESHEAGKVKKQVPILVVLGNPPYSGISSNKGEWITEKIESYKYVDGEHFKEKKHWLQDDYVKFIRFAQWKIDEAGEGVVGFITNHSYLDNPTFRGMRQSLMNSFDEIYILDLHGNNLKKEKAPDGSKDENVFDIQQGVAIAFFIKHKKSKTKSIFHQEIYGLREAKYNWLNKHTIENVRWKKLKPKTPYYFLISRDERYSKGYNEYPSVQEIFPINNVGLVTARDSFAIDFELDKLKRRVKDFTDLKITDDEIRIIYKLKDSSTFKLSKFRNQLSGEVWDKYFKNILYRPFDLRKIVYTKWIIERPIYETMKHMLKENSALCIGRQFGVIGGDTYDIVFVSENLVDFNLFRRGGELVFPLYIYPEQKRKKSSLASQMMMFEPAIDYEAKQPNINPELFAELNMTYQKEVTPEELFYYIYAILYSNTYRTKYVEFLKIDFPRIPFTKGYKLFIQLGTLGKKLAELHLLKSSELDNPIAQFPIEKGNSNKVEKLRYEEEFDKTGKIWINENQYFDGISEEVWQYRIGGYQVCEKWLKDRKGRSLTADEVRTYCKIVTAISKTIELQKEIDKHFDDVEKT